MVTPLDPGKLLEALNHAGVKYIVIGGFAVSAHGHPRATRDLDIVPDPTPDNLFRLAKLLATLDAKVMGLEEFREEEFGLKLDVEGLAGGGNYVLLTRFGRLDILQLVAPDLEFADLSPTAVEDTVFGQLVRFCSYKDLIRMKEASGRPEDLLDVKRLKEARGELG